MTTTLIMTFTASDQPGVVERISAAVADNGGNWMESRMAHLAEKFAGVILIGVADKQLENMEKSLLSLESGDFHVRLERARDVVTPAKKRMEIDVFGFDHPGIVHELTRYLASHGFSVEEMETTVEDAPVSGGTHFRAKVIISGDAAMDDDALADALQTLGNALEVDIDLVEPV